MKNIVNTVHFLLANHFAHWRNSSHRRGEEWSLARHQKIDIRMMNAHVICRRCQKSQTQYYFLFSNSNSFWIEDLH